MLANVAVDTFGGTIPLIGDAFDVAFKSNSRNVQLLERALERPTETGRASRLLVVGSIVALVLLAAGAIVVAVLLIRASAGSVSTH